MNIERRLHHAVRELREVTIEAPALDDLAGRPRPRPRPRPRLAALAAPMLFVAGGVLAVGMMQRSVDAPVHRDFGGVAPETEAEADAGPAAAIGPGAPAPSVNDELRLIRGIVESAPERPEVGPIEPPATAAGPN